MLSIFSGAGITYSRKTIPVFIGCFNRIDGKPLVSGYCIPLSDWGSFSRQYDITQKMKHGEESWSAASLKLYFTNGGGGCYILPVINITDLQPDHSGNTPLAVALRNVPEVSFICITENDNWLSTTGTGLTRNGIINAIASEVNDESCRIIITGVSSDTAPTTVLSAGRVIRYKPYIMVNNADDTAKMSLSPECAVVGSYVKNDKLYGICNNPDKIKLEKILGVEERYSFLRSKGNFIASDGFNNYITQGGWTTATKSPYLNIMTRRVTDDVKRYVKYCIQLYSGAPNDISVWTAIKSAINNYIRSIWLDGGIQGATPSDAYIVECGVGESMTDEDVNNGILKVNVYFSDVHIVETVYQTLVQKR